MKAEFKKLMGAMIPAGLIPGDGRSRYRGDYITWQDALDACTGYDSDLILQKVKDATLKVLSGEAAYERDSVIFAQANYSWPVLAGLLWAASRNGGSLHVLDFGGSLGSAYFQNRRFLSHLKGWSWNVVEQGGVVRCGKEMFEDSQLRFYSSAEECLDEKPCNFVLLSSVLSYLESPHELIHTLVSAAPDVILIDRTPLLTRDRPDRLTVQTVPSCIYKASYPAWFFNRRKLISCLEAGYQLEAEWDTEDRISWFPAEFKGFLFAAKA